MRIRLLILLSICFIPALAQETSLPVDTMPQSELIDTFYFVQPSRLTVKSLEEVAATIVDTLTSPLVYIIEDRHKYFQLCIPVDSGFAIIETGLNCYVGEVSVERINFNKTGSEELVLRWNQGTGISTWTHGWAEHNAGVQIWNLDQMQLLFSFENYTSSYSYWQLFADDTSGKLLFEEREIIDSGWEATCVNHKVTITPGEIKIVQNAECPDLEESVKYVISDTTTYRYILGQNCLFRNR